MSKGDRNVSERKNGKNPHLLGFEAWCCPEAGRTFRERRDRSPAPRARKGARGMNTHTLAFLLSTGRGRRDEIGLESVLNKHIGGGLCIA